MMRIDPRLRYCAYLTLLILFSIWLNVTTRAEENDHHLHQVRTRDFFVSTTVVGELGYPLGKEIRVKGTWIKISDKSDSGLWFSITHVNKRKLDSPIRFGESVVQSVDTMTKKPSYSVGDVWELRGFESGVFTGLPREYYTNEKFRELALPQGGAFAFVNTFEYLEIFHRGGNSQDQ
jgi:hypothetical protein